jgi:hypothetical protein
MDRFGVTYSESNYINYWYMEEDLPELEAELKVIEDSMGDQMELYEAFFSKGRGYNNQTMEEAGLDKKHLSDYADYKFAERVRDYVKEHGQCSFEVEL